MFNRSIYYYGMKPGAKRKAVADARADRADETRQRLLEAAVGVFGRHGFEGASTRMLTEAAGVNLQAIAYYFDSKEGLYLAVAQYIGECVKDRMSPLTGVLRERLQHDAALTPSDARVMLQQMMTAAARLFLHEESAPWARFVIREQMEPTAAFDEIYARVTGPMLQLARLLLGKVLGQDPNSEVIRLRALSTMGQVLILRSGRATLMRELAWTSIGEAEHAAVEALMATLASAITPAPRSARRQAAVARSPALANKAKAARKPRNKP